MIDTRQPNIDQKGTLAMIACPSVETLRELIQVGAMAQKVAEDILMQ